MNPHLVTCLLISALSGVVAGGLVVTAGWGWAFALLAYSFVGSASLVAATMVLLPGEAHEERHANVVAKRQDGRALA